MSNKKQSNPDNPSEEPLKKHDDENPDERNPNPEDPHEETGPPIKEMPKSKHREEMIKTLPSFID